MLPCRYRHILWTLFLFTAVACMVLPSSARGLVLAENTVWQGQVLVDDDIVVPHGVSLTVRAGTVVTVVAADSTKTDPEYMSSLTEITVRGSLLVEGKAGGEVLFRLLTAAEGRESWAGIIVDGGTAVLQNTAVRDAETGIWVLGGKLELTDSILEANNYGLVVQKNESAVQVTGSTISGNAYGIVTLNGAVVDSRGSTVADNRKQDTHSFPAGELREELPVYDVALPQNVQVMGDEVLMGDVIWQGRITVNGRVRVPADSRLIIMPGTVVEFSKEDSNGDGIGENGIMLQGVLIAKGTAEKPILFRSAEEEKKAGDWDAVNIINSDGARNIIEYCQFEDAYRGLHFHFSNVVIQYSIFSGNLRGVQFQESTVELHHNHFHRNTSAIQARDSQIVFKDNRLLANIFGANFFRAHLTIAGNIFSHNLDFGLKIREGYPAVSTNTFARNRFGLMFSDANYGVAGSNLLLQNSEAGMSLRASTGLEIRDNFVQGNGLSGISLRDTVAVITGNHISENGERGLGLIAFQGEISSNSFTGNRLYAIALEDSTDVAARGNWFGTDDIPEVVFDREDDPGRGRLDYMPPTDKPFSFAWPQAAIPADVRWSGAITVPATVAVPAGVTLEIKPGTRVSFARQAGLYVRGSLLAVGTPGQRITFTAADGREAGSWGEVRLEYSHGSRFANCDIEFASWGIHSHFNAMSIIGCTFTNNGGGIRFRSGPLLISNCLFRDNDIGIRAYRGKAQIRGNIITDNRKGIFVREKGGGLSITGNNIYGNLDYHIWVGDFNKEDVSAGGNWWGTDDPREKFFDARREPGIGFIQYEPVLDAPLDLDIVDREVQ